jgi:hypothetical protein
MEIGMRKLAFVLFTLGILILVISFYPAYAEKPVLDGEGPMSIQIDPAFTAPEYHNPLDWWKTHHMDIVNRGDLTQQDCLYCHDPDTSCNNCHNYVGAGMVEK